MALPPLILGALCLAGSFLVLFLPETLNRTIPSTLADGENFGRGEGLFDFACWTGKLRRPSADKVMMGPDGRLHDSQTTIGTNA